MVMLNDDLSGDAITGKCPAIMGIDDHAILLAHGLPRVKNWMC